MQAGTILNGGSVLLQIGALLNGCTAKNLPNLRNLAMELRKVCCHPVRLCCLKPVSNPISMLLTCFAA